MYDNFTADLVCFIGYVTGYKSHLANIKLIPIMYFHEFEYLLSFIQCLLNTKISLKLHSFVLVIKSISSLPKTKGTFAWFRSYYLLPSFPPEQTCLLVEQSTIRIKYQWGISGELLLGSFIFQSDHPCSFYVNWLCSNCSSLFPNLFCVLNRTGNNILSSLLH